MAQKRGKRSASTYKLFAPLNEVGTAKFVVPQSEWATYREEEKRDAWDHIFLSAIKGAIRDHPNCLFGYDFRELHPEAKDLLDASKDPEIIGEVHVSIWKPLHK